MSVNHIPQAKPKRNSLPRPKVISATIKHSTHPKSGTYYRTIGRSSGKPLQERVTLENAPLEGFAGTVGVTRAFESRSLGSLRFNAAPIYRGENIIIHAVIVKPPYRRQGIVQQMLSEVLFLAKRNGRAKRLVLEVHANNKNAIKSYTTFGFKEVARRAPKRKGEPERIKMVYEW